MMRVNFFDDDSCNKLFSCRVFDARLPAKFLERLVSFGIVESTALLKASHFCVDVFLETLSTAYSLSRISRVVERSSRSFIYNFR